MITVDDIVDTVLNYRLALREADQKIKKLEQKVSEVESNDDDAPDVLES